MEIMELAHEIGLKIKESEQMQRTKAAEAAFDGDADLQAKIAEYNAHDAALASTEDNAFNDAIEKRMKELYAEVTANPIYVEYMNAQEAVNKLMTLVNSEINFAITGSRGCSEDGCASCSGCGHSH